MHHHHKKKSKIRLLLVSSVFGDRGTERLILFLYRFLPNDIYETKIVCLRDLSPYADYLNKNTDIKIDIIGMKNNIDFPALFRFYKYIRKLGPDIINFHHYRAALWGRPLARLAKIPVVLYSVHNKWGGATHHYLDRKMARFTNAIIPFSLAVRDYLIDVEGIAEKYVTDPIYAGIDINRFNNISKSETDQLWKEFTDLGIHKDAPIIGYVGNITREKGLIYLIESVKYLKNKFRNICCLLIGEGPDEDYLKNLISEYKLGGNIKFLGTRYDIPNLLNIMNIFVLPSLREGLPLVIIEALAAGCPVIATNVDGIPEILSHNKNGLLVPPENVKELTSAIETLLSNDRLRNRFIGEGLITVKSKFSIDKMVNDYSQLYQSYLNRLS